MWQVWVWNNTFDRNELWDEYETRGEAVACANDLAIDDIRATIEHRWSVDSNKETNK